jgi:hypothetical protein
VKLKLVPEAGRVLRRAWNIRLIAAAGILSDCEIALPIIDQIVSIPRGIFAALSGATRHRRHTLCSRIPR